MYEGKGALTAQHRCPHMAALLNTRAELPRVLARFYALGARRNGWLWFGSLPGESGRDREALIEAGLDVGALEARTQLTITELDLTVEPHAFVEPWATRADEALRSGYSALWFARFPIEPGRGPVAAVLPFEAAWMERFRGGRAVTLCPYIVGGLQDEDISEHVEMVRAVHDDVRRVVDEKLLRVAS
jgi:hypothetical protein